MIYCYLGVHRKAAEFARIERDGMAVVVLVCMDCAALWAKKLDAARGK